MTDDELRRKLFWQQLGEFLVVAACASTVAYWAAQLLFSAIEDGQVTLYAGGRSGPRTPVKLSVEELPYGVAGAVLLVCSFAIGVLRLLSSPTYHVLRTGIPRLALPRVPTSPWLRRATTAHFGAVLFLGALGVVLVVIQYIAVALR